MNSGVIASITDHNQTRQMQISEKWDRTLHQTLSSSAALCCLVAYLNWIPTPWLRHDSRHPSGASSTRAATISGRRFLFGDGCSTPLTSQSVQCGSSCADRAAARRHHRHFRPSDVIGVGTGRRVQTTGRGCAVGGDYHRTCRRC